MTTEKDGLPEIPEPPETDRFGQEVESYEVEPGDTGIGTRCQCKNCGRQCLTGIYLYAATADSSNDSWQEFYVCQCGATGTFYVRYTDGREDQQLTGSLVRPNNPTSLDSPIPDH